MSNIRNKLEFIASS